MASGLKFKKRGKVRLIFGAGSALQGMDHVRQTPDKIFAVIGPFESHSDLTALQDALTLVCRGANLERR